MVDPRDQKFMPQKRDMILIRKKDVQSKQSSAAEEATKEEVDREEVATEESGVKKEAGPSRVNRSKLDDLMHKFEDFKGKTVLNFEGIKHQIQSHQSENSAKFEIVIQLLEGLKIEI